MAPQGHPLEQLLGGWPSAFSSENDSRPMCRSWILLNADAAGDELIGVAQPLHDVIQVVVARAGIERA
jgi:hypothetical protein